MDLKSKNISTLGNELSNIDREIDKIEKLSSYMKKIVFYDGSGEQDELVIWQQLDEPLKLFLLEFFNKQKNVVYDSISDILQS